MRNDSLQVVLYHEKNEAKGSNSDRCVTIEVDVLN
jgi:hypothetical protein